VDSRRPLGRGAPASSTWASFAPPLRVIAISTGGPPRSGHRGPGQSSPAGAPFSVPEPLSSLAAVPSPLAGPDPTRLGESSLLPLPPPPPAAPAPAVHGLRLVVGGAQAGKVSVRDSLRDAVTGCTTSPRRSSYVAYPSAETRVRNPAAAKIGPRRSSIDHTRTMES
jgi:hypothetical protein